MNNNEEVLDAEEVLGNEDEREGSRALELRSPKTPTTINELAVLRGEGVEITQARATIVNSLRRAAISITHPEDWLLFKEPDAPFDTATAYLQDSGADRVRDLYGITIFDVGEPQKVPGNKDGEFFYIIRGSGYCAVANKYTYNVEGGRSSKDDFCKYQEGPKLDLYVRKAARANLDGSITRELTGLQSVPVSELASVWAGTKKDVSRCREGRGFGTKAERHGAQIQQAEEIPVEYQPKCPVHQETMKFIKAGEKNGRPYGAFWACRDRTCKETMRHSDAIERYKMDKRDVEGS